ncbi:MAG: hypothetical protein AB7V43_20255 [Acidimicrobiia bacterium]
MNFVSHVVICAAQGGDADNLIGAAAPDLVPRASLPYAKQLSSSLSIGIAHHEAIDELFHNDRWFLDYQTMAATSMIDRGVPAGAAHLAGHVGIELLIDGVLLESDPRPQFWQMWDRLRDVDETTRSLVDPEHLERWNQWLAGFTGYIDPRRYGEPTYCARIVAGISRRLLGSEVDDDHERQIASVLDAVRPTVRIWTAGLFGLLESARSVLDPDAGSRARRMPVA